MSTLSEHTGNGKPPETRRQREGTKEQLDDLLQHFDVLPSRVDRFLFKYIYVYLISLFFLAELLIILSLLARNLQVGGVLLQGVGLGVPPLLVIILVIWRFNIWRGRTPKTLRDLLKEKRIALPDGDAETSYLGLLERYREALASPKRFFLSGLLMIVLGITFANDIVQNLSSEHPNNVVMILLVGNLLFAALLQLGGYYCIGILTWAMYISGWYLRQLVRAFQLGIQPFHPDQCGGLTLLGNFCFGLASPLLIASGIFIGYSLFALSEYSPAINGSENSYLVLNVYAPLLFVLFSLLMIVFVFILPLREIHTKMVSEAKTNETLYFTRAQALREEIQALLDANQIEAAKAVQEEKALVETLYAPYPGWPFRFRSKLSSTVLEVSGSLLIGVLAAEVQQYLLPAIVTLLFHTP
jgi:hypothetical protein